MISSGRVTLFALLVACGRSPVADDDAPDPDGGNTTDCGTPTECAAIWEQNASDQFDAVLADPTELAAFLKAVPKGGDLHSRRIVARDIQDNSVLQKLFSEIAPKYAERPGGYCRILKIGVRRGDAVTMALIELV